MKSLLGRLARPLRQAPRMGGGERSPPLDEADVAALLAQCDRQCPALVDSLLSLKSRQGPFASPFLGAGFEYRESRPYQPGDALRQLNWRYFARTGQLFTRLYEQERQARLLLVVDLRQPMRFGTQVRLKATQAIRLAIALAHEAARRQQSVQALPLWEGGALSPVWSGQGVAWQATEWLNRPLPPDEPTSDTWDCVRLAVETLPAGSIVALIGHLWDMPEDLARWLGAQQPARASAGVWIWDRVERRLPQASGVRLQSLDGHAAMALTPAQAARFQRWADEAWRKTARRLLAAGISVWQLRNDEELSSCEPFHFGE